MTKSIERYFYRRIKNIDDEPSGPHLLLICTLWKRRITHVADGIEEDRKIVASEMINEPVGEVDPKFLALPNDSVSFELEHEEFKRLMALCLRDKDSFYLYRS